MTATQQSQRRLSRTGVSVLFALGWLPIVAAELHHRHPHEYMALDLLLPMLWLCGCSLVGIACAVYWLYRAEAEGRPMALPLVLALLNLPGIVVPLWWFF
jgi:hypothetical protein